MASTLRNPRAQLTVDAARELFEAATIALFEEADVYEILDLRAWRQKFAQKANEIADQRGDELDSGATSPLDAIEGE